MGYDIRVTESYINISGENFKPMMKALNAQLKEEDMAPVKTLEDFLMKATSANNICIEQDAETDEITSVVFEASSMNCSEIESIAPFVRNGSWLEFIGEEGDRFRWIFKNGEVLEQNAKVAWEPERYAVIDSDFTIYDNGNFDLITAIREFGKEKSDTVTGKLLMRCNYFWEYFAAIGGQNVEVVFGEPSGEARIPVYKGVYFSCENKIEEEWFWAIAPFIGDGYIQFLDTVTKEQYRIVFCNQEVRTAVPTTTWDMI